MSSPRQVLLEKAREVDALVTDRIDRVVLTSAQYAVGYENIGVQYATVKAVRYEQAGVQTGATIDLAWALLIAVARRIVESYKFVRSDEYGGTGIVWYLLMMLGYYVTGNTVEIIGMDRIGQGVASRAKGFSMCIIYQHHRLTEETERGALAQGGRDAF